MRNQEIFQKVFDIYTQKNIIEFVNRVNLTAADYYIVMARKGKCFWDYLVDMELINVPGKVITERCLDMDVNYLEGSNVIIVDDIVISGTSIYSVIRMLQAAKVKSLKVCVLGVDECFNSSLFDYDVVNENGEKETRNYLMHPYIKLNNSTCVSICSSIVCCFSYVPKAYDVDFPVFKKITLSDRMLRKIVSYYAWEVYDVTAEHQVREGISVLTLIPNSNMGIWLNEKIGFNIMEHCFVKIRMFIQNRQKSKKTSQVSIVPYVLFDEVYAEDIEKLFDSIVSYLTDARENSRDKIKCYEQYFLSNKSKSRFVQYVLALKLANIWSEGIRDFCGKQIELIPLRENFASIFTEIFYADIIALNNSERIFYGTEIREIEKEILKKLYSFESSNSRIEGDVLWSVHAKLTEPFTYLYQKKELRSRELVRKYGKEVYEKDEYKDVVGRLNMGYSHRYLKKLVEDVENYDAEKVVSLYIDKAIDAGIIVPVICEKNGIMYRAYRHGEDIPFGDREFRACTLLLKEYSADGRNYLMRNLRIEKILMLMLKINYHLQLFPTFITGEQDESALSKGVVQGTHFIHGQVATYHERGEYHENRPKRYMERREKYVWLTDVLKKKGILAKDEGETCWHVEFTADRDLDQKLYSEISIMGQLFGILCMNAAKKQIPCLTDDDLVMLSSCLIPEDTISALAAEIGVFKYNWDMENRRIELNAMNAAKMGWVINELNNQYLCTSINSGIWKYESFLSNRGADIIDRVCNEMGNEIYRQTWKKYWPSNYRWNKDSVSSEYMNLIYKQGKWFYYQVIATRLLAIAVWKQRVSDPTGKENIKKGNRDIDKCVNQVEICIGKLENSNDTFAAHIIKYTRATLDEFESGQYVYQSKIKEIIKIINYLSRNAVSIMDEADLILNKYGIVHKIIRFGSALFIENVQREYYIDTDTGLQRLINEVFQIYSACEFHLIPNSENKMSRGLWIIASGSDSVKFLTYFALEYRKKHKNKCRYFGFYGLNDSVQIKKADMANTNYRYGLFWDTVKSIYQDIDSHGVGADELVITYCNSRKYRTLSRTVEEACQNYNMASMWNDESSVNELIKTENHHIEYFKENAREKERVKKVDFAIITVLAPETRAVLQLLTSRTKETINGRTFYYGQIIGEENKYNVVVCSQTSQGNISSALMYEQMKRFSPRYVILFGIAGGVSDKVKINDVVLATDVIGYEKMKEVDRNVYRHRGQDQPLEKVVLNAITQLEIEYGEEPEFSSVEKNDGRDNFKVFNGPIGSGEIVFASEKSDIKEWMMNFNDKVKAVETEGFGVVSAYYENRADKKSAPVMIIRGISDTADNEKGDLFRESCCKNAAVVLKALLQFLE